MERVVHMARIAPLFTGMTDTLILSCLQGWMGDAWADDGATPRCAQIVLGDFTPHQAWLESLGKLARERGAKRIVAVLGHIMLREKGVKAINESPIETVISTDSVENPFIIGQKKFQTVWAGRLIHRF